MEQVNQLIGEMQGIPGFAEVKTTKDFMAAYVTYAVVQGSNILTIGSGKKERLKVLMGNRGSHNKAPLIGLCHRLYPCAIRFFVCNYTDPEGGGEFSVEERALQNKFGSTWIDGHADYGSAMRYLRGKLESASDPIESILKMLLRAKDI